MIHVMEGAHMDRSAGSRPEAPLRPEEWPGSRDELLEIFYCPVAGDVSCECLTSLIAAIDIFERGRSPRRRVS